MISLDNLISGFVPYPINFYKSSIVTEGAGTFMTLIKCTGTPNSGYTGPAFTAGNGYQVSGDNKIYAGLPIPNISSNLYLTKFGIGSTTIGGFILHDRLWHCTGFNCNTTNFQNVTTPEPMPPRDNFGSVSGYGLEIWGEIHGVPGATAGTWHVYYTNTDGVANRTGTYQHPANAETQGQSFPFNLQGSDKGVSQISGVRLIAASAATGNLGIAVIRRLADITIPVASCYFNSNIFDLGMPVIYPKSCLQLMQYANAITAVTLLGSISLASG